MLLINFEPELSLTDLFQKNYSLSWSNEIVLVKDNECFLFLSLEAVELRSSMTSEMNVLIRIMVTWS